MYRTFTVMKKMISIFTLILCFSCNDGDFEVPAFEFTETINHCGSFILYKTNAKKTEAFILTIPSESFKEVEKETYTLKLSSTIFVTYRAFDSAFTENYFCSAIPPTKPKVINELFAKNGEVIITTTKEVNTSKSTTYNHEIILSDIVLKKEKNENKITFKKYNFGTFSIRKP